MSHKRTNSTKASHSERKVERSRDRDSSQLDHIKELSRIKSEMFKKGGLTPLYFKGTEGTVMLPRKQEAQLIAKKLVDEPKTTINPETGMNYVGQYTLQESKPVPSLEWEEAERELERVWYDCEEEGNVKYGGGNEYDMFYGANEDLGKKEEEVRKKKLARTQPVSKQAANNIEHDKWELNRMIVSGAIKVTMNEEDNQLDNEECRVIIMVHDIKPPFLGGANVSTNQVEQIQVVKDPKSDLSVLARKGSSILKFIRERNDRSLMKERFWELAGSKMGNILKVQKEEVIPKEVKLNDDGSVDYKADLQYAPSLRKKFGPASEFSKSKTLQEQREFLPIYGIKEELMKVINQNKM